MLQDLTGLHDAHDSRLQVQLAIIINSTHGVLYLLLCLFLQRSRNFELGSLVGVVKI